MNKETILDALSELGSLAKEKGIQLEVSIYGGAAFMLAFDSRAATKDIDAILKPREEGEKLVVQVARRLDMPEDWLNSNVKQFVSPLQEARRRLIEIEERTGLTVFVPSTRYLLAMKALACRRPLPGYLGDQEDLQFLIRKMNIQSVEAIQEAIDSFFPDDIVSAENRAYLESLIQQAHA